MRNTLNRLVVASLFVTAAVAQQPAARNYQLILSGSQLYPPFDLGINTSQGRTNWLFNERGHFRLVYPGGEWGAFFITNGRPVDRNRPGLDLSAFDTLEVELRGEGEGRSVQIGMKDNTMDDSGREPKQTVALTGDWRVTRIPLSSFRNATATLDVRRVYVALEVVFDQSGPLTVYLRNARFVKTGERPCQPTDPLSRAWWNADMNNVDTVGANNGRAEGRINFSAGVSNDAFNFSSGTMTVPSTSSLRLSGADSVTVDLWYKRLDQNPVQYILGQAEGCPAASSVFQLAIGPNDFPASTIPLNTWTHLALILANGVADFYVNGVQVNRRPLVIQPTTAPWRIGGVGSCTRTNSMIDEVAITGRALSQTDLYDAIDRGATNRCKVSIAAVVNSASSRDVIAPDSLVTIYGTDLAANPRGTEGVPVQKIDGLEVIVQDSDGNKPAMLYYVSPMQVNVVLPKNAMLASSVLSLRREGVAPKSFAIEPHQVAPGLLTANGNGRGAPLGTLISVSPSGQPEEQPLFVRAATGVGFDPRPLTIPGSGSAYLVLYGTGFRNRQRDVAARIGDQSVPVQYAGEQPQYPGLDQLNIGPLPSSLTGRGSTMLTLTADSVDSNAVSLIFR